MAKYFKTAEFDSPDEIGSGKKMDEKFVKMLDKARHIADIPFKINSAYRTEKWNERVGGRVGSSHLKGVAVDIHCNTSHSRSVILYALIKVGFRRIGIADTFIHVDSDADKNDAVWLY